jgi:uncharacterized protein with GYD domain
MPTYVTLVSYTQQGIENIKDSPQRLDAAKKAYASLGAKLKDFYLVMGRYDIVLVSDGPDDETMAKVALALGSMGNIRSETLRAFTEEEFRSIVSTLP